jgi:hypothetical protein
MPVTFSRRVVGRFEPSAFAVSTRSGAVHKPLCATTRPAAAASERHTVLLIGELGSEPADPPVKVEVIGSLPLEDGDNAQGLSGPVIPLADGPTLALAMAYKPGAIASDCPTSSRQIVVVVWTGGVQLAPAAQSDQHRSGYQVATGMGTVTPVVLGDLDDRDNYVHLCLDSAAPAQQVSFPAGILVDPRGDLNPATSIEVSSQK